MPGMSIYAKFGGSIHAGPSKLGVLASLRRGGNLSARVNAVAGTLKSVVTRSPRRASAARAVSLALAAGVLLAPVAKASAENVGHVAILHHDGSSYEGSATVPNSAPRERASREFFATHRDAYDFLIVFPAFLFDLTWNQAELGGLHTPVRNEVTGTGRQVGPFAGSFGSNTRLKAYIDINTLVPGHPQASLDQSLVFIAHEVAHQWSGEARYRDASGTSSGGLLGQDGAHWSYFLSSQASVLYGSDWKAAGPGQFTATGSMRRYSDLDLYLMGLLSPVEVRPFTLIRPAVGTTAVATDLPPPNGTMLSGAAETIIVDQVVAANGPRLPAASASQRTFRAAFAILAAPGQTPTAEQVAFVDGVRRQWANQFFFMTRGRAVMETDLLEAQPSASAVSPSVDLGLVWLLSSQRGDGAWADSPDTAARETQLAMEALALFGGSPGVPASLGQGAGFLSALQPVEADTSARRFLGLRAASPGLAPDAVAPYSPSAANPDGGLGLARGYGSTILDSVLAGLAGEGTGASLDGIADYLLAAQRGDGGWPWIPGGRSDLETTSLVLQFLAKVGRSLPVVTSATAGMAYLRARRAYDFSIRDPDTDDDFTAEAALAFDAWDASFAPDAKGTMDALLARQWSDGSWEGSAKKTAVTVRALRSLNLPNLVIETAEIQLASSSATEGEIVPSRLLVHNLGYTDAPQVQVQAFDSLGRPFGPPVVIPTVKAFWHSVVDLALDTSGHAGSSQVFFVADPQSTIDEKTKQDNRASAPLRIDARPAGVDLFAAAGSVVVAPSVVDRAAATVSVTATVGNAGQTAALDVEVALMAGTTVIGTARLAFPAASTQAVTLSGPLPRVLPSNNLQVVVDPSNYVAEARKDNNVASGHVNVVPAVDLAVRAVSATPTPVDLGGDLLVRLEVVNDGTVDSATVTTSLALIDAGGAVVARVAGPRLAVPRGGNASGAITWRASDSKAVLARVEVACQGDVDPSNDSALTAIAVNTSTLPNLAFGAGGMAFQPEPPDEGAPTSVTVQVRNAGAALAGAFAVEFWAGDPASGGKRLASEEVSGLAPGEQRPVTMSFQVPIGPSLVGIAQLDPDNRVLEFDETDNRLVQLLEPRSRSDLVVSSGGIRPSNLLPRQGEVVPVRVTVRNAGGQPSGVAPVALYRGAPEAGGVLLGATTVPALPRGGQTDLEFQWDTTGLEGTFELVAVVNADRSTLEARYDNNRAARTVAVQAANLSLSEPYFSPDGDGVKDTTEVLFRFDGATAPGVVIFDARGRAVRTLACSTAAGSGSAIWDGRDGNGQIVRDGPYLVSVQRGADRVAATVVVVDTNRSTVLQSPRELIMLGDVGAGALATVPADAHGPYINVAGATPDDDEVVFEFSYYTGYWWDSVKHCQLLRVPVEGGVPATMTPDGWGCPLGTAVQLGPDGRSVYYLTVDGTGRYLPFRFDMAARTAAPVVPTALDGGGYGYSQLEIGTDAASLYAQSGSGVERIAIDGSGARSVTGWQSIPMFSPDGAMGMETFFGSHGTELHVRNADGLGDRAVVVEYPQPQCLEWGPGEECARWEQSPVPTPPGALVLPDGTWLSYHAWVSATEIAYLAGGLYLFDLTTWKAEELMPAEMVPFDVRGLMGDPSGQRLAINLGTQVWTYSLVDGSYSYLHDWTGLEPVDNHIDSSRTGRTHVATLWGSSSPSYAYRSVSTLANLGLRLSGVRRPGSSEMVFRGTAADLNLDFWELSARPRGSSAAPFVLASGAETVLDGELVRWTPPAPGVWEAKLHARDRAGNVRSITTLASWAEVPAIANVRVNPRLFSPNGDGRQDLATVSYSVQEPVSTVLEISNPSGAVVRSLPMTHAQTGNYVIEWDGRDVGGLSLPDGTYRFAVGKESAQAILDSTYPVATLALGSGGAGMGLLPIRVPFEYRPPIGPISPSVDCPPMTDRQKLHFSIPNSNDATVLGVAVSYRASDDHLVGYEFQAASVAAPASFATFDRQSGNVDQLTTAALIANGLPGPYLRLRAVDGAGNETTTLPIEVPEALAVTASGPGLYTEPACMGYAITVAMPSVQLATDYFLDSLSGLGTAPGVPIQGGSFYPLFNHMNSADGGFCPEPAVHGFAVENTIRLPVLSYSVAYQLDGFSGWFVDTDNVRATRNHAVIWDARALDGLATAVQVRATDTAGRVFASDVKLACRPEDTIDAETICATPVTSSSLSIRIAQSGSVFVDRTVYTLRNKETGETVQVPKKTASQGTTTNSSGEIVHSQEDVITLDLTSLTGCQYELLANRSTITGPYPPVPLSSFNACGLVATHSEVRGDTLRLSMSETHRKPIAWVDVYLSATASPSRLVGTVPGFEGTSPPVELSLADLPCQQDLSISARTHFLDGSAVSEELFQPGTCHGSSLSKSCASVILSAVRESTPICAGRPAGFGLSASASSPSEPIEAIDIQVSVPGLAPIQLGGTPFTPGKVVTSSAMLPGGTLADGRYLATALATDLTGRLTISKGVPIVLDATPPWMQVTEPSAGATVCPFDRLLPSGQKVRSIRVQGAVYDDHLEGLSVLFKCGSGQPQPVALTQADGALAAFDVGGQRGECEMVLEAHDAGGSYCLPSIPFHLAGNAAVSGGAWPTLFSPNADGVLDFEQLVIGVQDPSSVQVVGKDSRARQGLAWSGFVQPGAGPIPWDGRLDGVPAADGDVSLEVSAVDPCNGTTVAQIAVKVDTTPPLVRLDSPVAGARAGGLATLTGEISDANFLDYEVALGAGTAPTTFQVVDHSFAPALGPISEVITSRLAAGPHTLRVTAHDRAGNQSVVMVTIEVAPREIINLFSTAPGLISPNGDGMLDTTTAQFQLLADATTQLDLVDATGTLLAVVQPPAPTLSGDGSIPIPASVLATLASGWFALRLTATVASLTEQETVPFTVDLKPPSLSIDAPGPGASIARATPVTGAVADEHLESWSLTIEGGGTTSLATGTAPTRGILASLDGLAEGDHRLRLSARDRAGNPAATEVAFSVDRTPPAVAFISPLDGGWLSGLAAPALILAEVKDSRLASVNLESTPSGGTAMTVFSAPVLSLDGRIEWPTTAAMDGPVQLRLVAIDLAGNAGDATISVTLDSTPPVALIAAPRETFLRSGDAILGTASDVNLASWTLELADGPPLPISIWALLASGQGSIDSGALATLATLPPDGAHALRLTVTDHAGNSSVDTIAFVVDTTSPQPPPALTATPSGTGVALAWQPSPDGDVVGYIVERATGLGGFVEVGPAVAGLSLMDQAVGDGAQRYVVVAVDAAGLRSVPSPEAPVSLDRTPPQVAIDQPIAGAAVSGLVQVRGTAFSASDFREYRLTVGAGAAPTVWAELRRSSLPGIATKLGELDTGQFPDGSVQTIRLEAEDLTGNVAQARVQVVIDRQPPAPPVLTSATAAGSTAAITWTSGGEADLAGFLLLRDGSIANAPIGAFLSDVRPFLLSPGTLSYSDASLPDGSYTYEVQAYDRAGNASGLSNALTVEVETHPPHASIIVPVNFTRIQGVVDMVAEVPDQDVATVQFQVRPGGAADFQPLGAPVTRIPFHTSLDPAAFQAPVLEVRAIATDKRGNVDPRPSSVVLFAVAPPVAPVVTPRVTGGDVALSWSDLNPSGVVAGYEVARDGTSLVPAAGLPAGAATASGSTASAQLAADGLGYTAWTTPKVGVPWWQLDYPSAVLVRSISVGTYLAAEIEVAVSVAGAWVPLRRAMVSGYDSVPLSPELAIQGVRVTFLTSSFGTVGLYDVAVEPVALVTGPPLQDPYLTDGSHDYVVTAVSAFGLRTDGRATARVYAPTIEVPAPVTASSPIRVAGSGATAGADVSVLRGGTATTTATAAADGAFVLDVPLLDGPNELTAIATDAGGNVSRPSLPVAVTLDAPPAAILSLALGAVVNSDVALTFTAAGDTARISGFHVMRSGGGASGLVATLAPEARSFTDQGVPNGTYDYRVVAFNGSGIEGAASNMVTAVISIAPPDAPKNLLVAAIPGGGALRLDWDFAGDPGRGFLVERATAAVGPFAPVNEGALRTTLAYLDLGLANGTTYFYRVRYVDLVGNSGAPSAVASGQPLDSLNPERPFLTRPTLPGSSIAVFTEFVDVSGLAEPGSLVELRRDGIWVGEDYAGPMQLEANQLWTLPAGASYSVSADPRCYAITAGSGAASSLSLYTQVSSVSLSDAGLAEFGRVTFSPDCARFAFEATSVADGRRRVWSGASSDWSYGPTSTLVGEERAPAWSNDGARLAYEAVRPGNASSVVAVLDLVAASERVLELPGSQLGSPGWLPDGALLALAVGGLTGTTGLVRLPLDGAPPGSTLPIGDGFDRLAISPLGDYAAVSTSASPGRVLLIELASGAITPVSASGADGRLPVFAGARSLAYLSDGTLNLRSLATGVESSLGVIDPLASLAWTSRGLQGASEAGMVTSYLVGGPFTIAGIRLTAGESQFVATATDQAGHRSSPSEAIAVTFDGVDLPDLAVSVVLQPEIPVAGGPASALVTVRNIGGAAARPASVSVVATAPGGAEVASSMTAIDALQPGSSTIAIVAVLVPVGGTYRLLATIDPAGLVADANRSNNQVVKSFIVATTSVAGVSVSVLPSAVSVDGTVTATVQVVNPGLPFDASVQTRLVDGAGATVVAAAPATYAPLRNGVTNLSRTFAVGTTLAGEYQIVAEVRVGGAVQVQASSPVTVLPERSVSLSLAPNRAQLFSGDDARFNATIGNLSRNAALEGAEYAVTVETTTGTPVYTVPAVPLPLLWLGLSVPVTTVVPGQALASGDYVAHASVSLGSAILAEDSAPFSLVGRPRVVARLDVPGAGQSGAPAGVTVGSVLRVSTLVENQGGATALGIVEQLRVVSPETGAPLLTLEVPMGDLPGGAAVPQDFLVPTADLARGLYGLSLLVTHDGISEILATARFRVLDGQSPMLELVGPSPGVVVNGRVQVTVVARDDASGVAAVRVVMGGVEVALSRFDGSPLSGTWAGSVALAGEGLHELVVSAVDADGNDGRTRPAAGNPLPFQVVNDTVAPVLSVLGIVDGAITSAVVVPVVEATDLHLAATGAQLNGMPFLSGTPISVDDVYVLVAYASDAAANLTTSVTRFVVDRTPPVVTFFGVSDGAVLAAAVTPAVVVTDRNLATQTVLLDGQPFAEGLTVGAEGPHRLSVEARDTAGNTTSQFITFTIDTIPPEVVVAGFTDGEITHRDVAPTYRATDANLVSTTATLNGLPFVSGTLVHADGTYRLDVVALDAAGHRTEQAATFTIATQLPVITVSPPDGSYWKASVTPTWTVAFADPAQAVATLDGVSWPAGGVASVEGTHRLTVTVTNLAGPATAAASFVIDTTPPNVVIGGVSEGQVLRGPVTPSVSATDLYLATAMSTLDGVAWTGGAIKGEGLHALTVTASDLAGHVTERSVRFTIDDTPPTISIAGVSDGDLVNTTVLPQVTVTDLHLASEQLTIDDVTWLPGQSVSGEGVHVLAVVARDAAGNEARASVRFEIDLTPPVISIDVADGATFQGEISPHFSATDLHPGTTTATLDGQPFTSGTAVSAAGAHRLEVQARDLAGNLAVKAVNFSIVTHRYTVEKTLVARSARVLAFVLGSHFRGGEVGLRETFLRQALPVGTPINFVEDAQAFLAELRSGLHNVVVLLDAGQRASDDGEPGQCHRHGSGRGHSDEELQRLANDCDEERDLAAADEECLWCAEHKGSSDEACACRHARLDDLAEAELTESVFRGMGLVLVKASANEWPRLREATGVHFQGATHADLVQVSPSALGAATRLHVDGGIELRLDEASRIAAFVQEGDHDEHEDRVAGGLRHLGLGAVVTLGFDLSEALPTADASALLAGAVAFVTSETILAPKGTVEVRIEVAHTGPAVTTQVTETVGPDLGVAGAFDGALSVAANQVQWERSQADGQRDVFRYLLRLPTAAGNYLTMADVTAGVGAGALPFGPYSLSVVVTEGASELLASARGLATRLTPEGQKGSARRTILKSLEKVEFNAGVTTADRERAIADLLDAAAAAKTIEGTNGFAMRLAIGRLLGFWESLP